MTIEEIYAIPADDDGWRVLPNKNILKIGSNVIAPHGIDLDNIGDAVSIGEGASIGIYSYIGEGANIGIYSCIEGKSSIGKGASIGYGEIIAAKETK
jgi:UDP-3-O-[3-hydroxymyristoyl] glucosamine N-acyltransferase